MVRHEGEVMPLTCLHIVVAYAEVYVVTLGTEHEMVVGIETDTHLALTLVAQ